MPTHYFQRGGLYTSVVVCSEGVGPSVFRNSDVITSLLQQNHHVQLPFFVINYAAKFTSKHTKAIASVHLIKRYRINKVSVHRIKRFRINKVSVHLIKRCRINKVPI